MNGDYPSNAPRPGRAGRLREALFTGPERLCGIRNSPETRRIHCAKHDLGTVPRDASARASDCKEAPAHAGDRRRATPPGCWRARRWCCSWRPGSRSSTAAWSGRRAVLNMMMMTVASIVILTVVWLAYGYSLAFTTDQGSRPDRRARRGRPVRHHDHHLRHDPDPGVRHLPADLRHHHDGPGERGDRRAGQVQRLVRVRVPVGDVRLRPDRALGLLLRRRERWMDRRPAGCARLRRRHGSRDQLGCGRPGDGDRDRSPAGLEARPDAPAQPAVRPAGCGPAVVRLVRLQRGVGARGQHAGRARARQHADRGLLRDRGLAPRGEGPGRALHLLRRGLGRDRGAGGDHPVVRVGDPARCRGRRRWSPAWPVPWPCR